MNATAKENFFAGRAIAMPGTVGATTAWRDRRICTGENV